ncbi:hypothetical protein [Winogradskyella schleiferi]|uniref:hypothetical protein n=1 Tax=Winogradskyella schleiferi TaxID=2686078 RepID=UPI0015BFE5AE|nr:hypothetical protein [Winogradskyella schleiferi]
MKKVFTLCLFVFALLVGSNSVMAQQTVDNTQIKTKTFSSKQDMRQHVSAVCDFVKANKTQRNQIYSASKALYEGKLNDESIEKLEKVYNETIKEALSKEQYELFKTYNLKR